jgi:hypothetical protein
MGTILRGWALTEQGQEEEGIVQMRQGLAAFRAMGAELFCPSWLALLAEMYGKVGQTEAGLSTLVEALEVVNKNGERWCEAELYRLKGQLTLQKFQVSRSKFHIPPSTQAESEAEEYFLKAIEIARQQQAKSLELRAVMSLSRLWQQQGKKAEARQMLAEVYGWFYCYYHCLHAVLPSSALDSPQRQRPSYAACGSSPISRSRASVVRTAASSTSAPMKRRFKSTATSDPLPRPTLETAALPAPLDRRSSGYGRQ